MNDDHAVSADIPEDGVFSDRWIRSLLLGTIVLLLAALVVIPARIGRRVDELRERVAFVVFPALDALHRSQSALSQGLASVRGYQITGDTMFLRDLRNTLARERVLSSSLDTLAGQIGPDALEAVRAYGDQTAVWLEGPSALLRGQPTRDQLIASVALGQTRFDGAISAGADARAALLDSWDDLTDRIDAAVRIERLLVVLLSLAALIVALIVGRLTYRIQRLSQQLRIRAGHLRESEERFRLIAENLPEMIWISDPSYSFQYYLSPAYESIWGLPIEPARHNPRSFLEAVHPDDREHVEAALQGYARGEYEATYRIVRPNGEIRWVYGRAYPVRDSAGEIFRVAGIAEDVTEQKQLELEREGLLERERRARSEVEASLRMRERVLRSVSHDLKNPLHTIGMAADLLEMPLTDEQKTRQIDIIRRTVTRANRLVADLLDAARIQAGGGIPIDPAAINVAALIAESIEAFRLQADAKHQHLTCVIAEGAGTVHADHDRMLQALSNILGNAVKFTPDGGRITVSVQPAGKDLVEFSVSDTGPGIPADLLPTLFEPFSQAKVTATKGTGLGLAIAHGIVEAHGGHISVETDPESGTTFTFHLRRPASENVSP